MSNDIISNNCYCKKHGHIPEENVMYSSGGRFCGIIINDEKEICFEPLEENLNGELNQ